MINDSVVRKLNVYGAKFNEYSIFTNCREIRVTLDQHVGIYCSGVDQEIYKVIKQQLHDEPGLVVMSYEELMKDPEMKALMEELEAYD